MNPFLQQEGNDLKHCNVFSECSDNVRAQQEGDDDAPQRPAPDEQKRRIAGVKCNIRSVPPRHKISYSVHHKSHKKLQERDKTAAERRHGRRRVHGAASVTSSASAQQGMVGCDSKMYNPTVS